MRWETLDKYEYRAKTEQMLAYAEQKSYQKAMSIADTIDWRKVKNTAMLSTVSEIYENAGELGKARDTLFIAYDKAPSSRKVVYRLGIISLKLGHFDEAADCYEEFVKLAPKDPNQYILRYKILKAQKAPVKDWSSWRFQAFWIRWKMGIWTCQIIRWSRYDFRMSWWMWWSDSLVQRRYLCIPGNGT